jgi:hypothetical protein
VLYSPVIGILIQVLLIIGVMTPYYVAGIEYLQT